MEREIGWDFIEVNAISSDPGNEVMRRSIRTGEILDYGVASSRFIQIGAASTLMLRGGAMMIVKESYEDLKELINNAERRTV